MYYILNEIKILNALNLHVEVGEKDKYTVPSEMMRTAKPSFFFYSVKTYGLRSKDKHVMINSQTFTTKGVKAPTFQFIQNTGICVSCCPGVLLD